VAHLMARLQAEAAVASDVGHLMDALPPLANVLRYGNVRQTDAAAVGQVVDGLAARICVGLPYACSSLNDEAAEPMFGRLVAVNGALAVLNDPEHLADWRGTVTRVMERSGVHGLVAGRCCRLLLEAREMEGGEAARRLGLALSRATDPPQAAAWV